MGWASGDDLLHLVWSHISQHLPEAVKKDVMKGLIRAFEQYDLDSYDCIESIPEGEAALRELHPKWFE